MAARLARASWRGSSSRRARTPPARWNGRRRAVPDRPAQSRMPGRGIDEIDEPAVVHVSQPRMRGQCGGRWGRNCRSNASSHSARRIGSPPGPSSSASSAATGAEVRGLRVPISTWTHDGRFPPHSHFAAPAFRAPRHATPARSPRRPRAARVAPGRFGLALGFGLSVGAGALRQASLQSQLAAQRSSSRPRCSASSTPWPRASANCKPMPIA